MPLPYELTQAQQQHLRDWGYVQIKGATPRRTIDEALRRFNARMGQGISDEEIAKSPAGGFFKEVTKSQPFRQLLPSPVAMGLAESALGEGNLGRVAGPQVALRFPKMGSAKPVGCHLDGLATSNNGVTEGELDSFSLLIATFLSPLPEPYMGNFTVWPGGHRVTSKWFEDHDYREVKNAFPPIRDQLGEPRQIIAEAGDIVLAHYLLPHGASQNLGPHIRYAAFHRAKHKDHDAHKIENLTRPFGQWEGLEAKAEA